MITSKYFNMGQIVTTKSINNLMNAEDKETNEDALNYPDDLYLMGAYNTSKGKIWIITNRISETLGDNATTVCFPDER